MWCPSDISCFSGKGLRKKMPVINGMLSLRNIGAK
jgi:hypothetical protein